VQQRLEASIAGRILLSVFIVAIVAGVVVWNLPPTELSGRAHPAVRPYINALGLDQNWAVFAPDPPREEWNLEARVVYTDGTERLWTVPTGDPLIGAYWDYRWLKWAEIMVAGTAGFLWLPAATWIAREEQSAGRQPVTVALMRRVTPLPLGGGRGPTTSTEFFVHHVADRLGE